MTTIARVRFHAILPTTVRPAVEEAPRPAPLPGPGELLAEDATTARLPARCPVCLHLIRPGQRAARLVATGQLAHVAVCVAQAAGTPVTLRP